MDSGRLHSVPRPRQACSFQVKKYKYFQHERHTERLGEAAVQSLSAAGGAKPPHAGPRDPQQVPGALGAVRATRRRPQCRTMRREQPPS